jgi:hypothetical protein
MEELRNLARGELIGDFIDNPPVPLSTENVSGVSLRIDDYWLGWTHINWSHRFYPAPFPPQWISSSLANVQRALRTFRGTRYLFSIKPLDWTTHCIQKGYPIKDAHPVTIVVILRKPFDPKLFAEVPRILGPHPIIYEYRPEAIGYAVSCGDYIGGAAEGTVGGFLFNTRDLSYHGMSCAHVLGTVAGPNQSPSRAYSPKPNVFGARTEIGTVTFSRYPLTSLGAKCNNRLQLNAPVIDLALVEVDGGTHVNVSVSNAGRVSSVSRIASLGQDDPVTFFGYQSSQVNAIIAEANIWKEIKIQGVPTCFGDLFVLDHPTHQYITTNVAKPGDSGAWIINTSGGIVSWDGMLVGGDGVRAYCCYSENIMNTLTNANQPLALP